MKRSLLRSVVLALATTFTSLVLPSCMDIGDGERAELSTHVKDWRDEVIYQVLIDRFADGDPTNNHGVLSTAPARYHGGDWRGLEENLDYIESLGVTALWISPVVKNVETDASVDGYHGYWAQDLTQPNPHFGDIAALRRLVKAAHARGIKVIVDIVTNHMGQLFFYDINMNGVPDVQIAESGTAGNKPVTHITEYDPDFDIRGIQSKTSLGEAGLAPIVFVYDPAANKLPVSPEILQRASSYNRRGRITNYDAIAYDADGKQVVDNAGQPYRVQTELGDFPGGLKDINTLDPDVRFALTQAYTQWVIETDIDGFRIDTVKHVEHEFWQYFAPAVRKDLKNRGKSNFLMFGEAFDGNDQKIGSYTRPAELDSVFYFSQYYTAIREVFQQSLSTDRIQALWESRATNWGNEAQPNGVGVAPSQMPINFLDNHDVARFLFFRNDPAALRNSLLFLFTAQGIPCLYYGTEQEFSGGNDPANREDLWTSGYATDGKTFTWVRKLIDLRKKHKALTRGLTKVVQSTAHTNDEADAGMFAFERSGEEAGDSYALVVLNTHPSKASSTVTVGGTSNTPITISQPEGTSMVDLLNPSRPAVTVGAGGSFEVELDATSGAIFVPAAQAN
ncbi:MAG: alpha-amylase family glycosyl hydrolase [Polyangiaceae bacterium]